MNKGDTVRYKHENEKNPIHKAKLKIFDISRRTGAISVEFLENAGAYKIGDSMVVMPYEITKE